MNWIELELNSADYVIGYHSTESARKGKIIVMMMMMIMIIIIIITLNVYELDAPTSGLAAAGEFPSAPTSTTLRGPSLVHSVTEGSLRRDIADEA
jgi:hypothetical protein